jgi:LPS-assembly lipoprotein
MSLFENSVIPAKTGIQPKRSRGSGWVPAFAGMTIALLLSACGFQLRGDPAVGLRTLYVSSVGASGVATDIRRALASGPTRVVTGAKDAEAQLRVLAEVRDKQVYTITGTGGVYEFELRLSVQYEMTMPGREVPVIVPTQVSARRVITYSQAAPIAKEAEEQLLFKDMQLELATRILRQIAIARRDM